MKKNRKYIAFILVLVLLLPLFADISSYMVYAAQNTSNSAGRIKVVKGDGDNGRDPNIQYLLFNVSATPSDARYRYSVQGWNVKAEFKVDGQAKTISGFYENDSSIGRTGGEVWLKLKDVLNSIGVTGEYERLDGSLSLDAGIAILVDGKETTPRYNTYSGIVNGIVSRYGVSWSKRTIDDLKTFFDLNYTFEPIIEEPLPTSVSADFNLLPEAYEYQDVGYEDISTAENSTIKHRKLKITGPNGYERVIENQVKPSIKLTEGLYTFLLRVENEYGDVDIDLKQIRIIKQKVEVDSDPIAVTNAPSEVQRGEKFNINSKGSMASSGAKIIEYRLYVSNNLSDLKNKLVTSKDSYETSSSELGVIYSQYWIKDSKGKEAWGNIAVTRITDDTPTSVKAKIDVPDIVYDGVPFSVSTAGSRVYYGDRSFSPSKAVEESIADYFYEFSTDYHYEDIDEDRLDASGGRVYVELKGTSDEKHTAMYELETRNAYDKDIDVFTIKPTPFTKFFVAGDRKINRKLTIDLSDTLAHINYPIIDSKTVIEIEDLKSGEKATITTSNSTNTTYIKTKKLVGKRADFTVKRVGDVKVTITTEDGRGRKSTEYQKLTIKDDLSPVARFVSLDTIYRGADGKARLKVEKLPFSPDSDMIEVEKMRYRADSNNNNRLDDETFININSYDEIIEIDNNKVGEIEIEYYVKETFDHIPEYTLPEEFLSDTVVKKVKIDNIAPITFFDVIKNTKADILVFSDENADQVSLKTEQLKSSLNYSSTIIADVISKSEILDTSSKIAELKSSIELHGKSVREFIGGNDKTIIVKIYDNLTRKDIYSAYDLETLSLKYNIDLINGNYRFMTYTDSAGINHTNLFISEFETSSVSGKAVYKTTLKEININSGITLWQKQFDGSWRLGNLMLDEENGLEYLGVISNNVSYGYGDMEIRYVKFDENTKNIAIDIELHKERDISSSSTYINRENEKFYLGATTKKGFKLYEIIGQTKRLIADIATPTTWIHSGMDNRLLNVYLYNDVFYVYNHNWSGSFNNWDVGWYGELRYYEIKTSGQILVNKHIRTTQRDPVVSMENYYRYRETPEILVKNKYFTHEHDSYSYTTKYYKINDPNYDYISVYYNYSSQSDRREYYAKITKYSSKTGASKVVYNRTFTEWDYNGSYMDMVKVINDPENRYFFIYFSNETTNGSVTLFDVVEEKSINYNYYPPTSSWSGYGNRFAYPINIDGKRMLVEIGRAQMYFDLSTNTITHQLSGSSSSFADKHKAYQYRAVSPNTKYLITGGTDKSTSVDFMESFKINKGFYSMLETLLNHTFRVESDKRYVPIITNKVITLSEEQINNIINGAVSQKAKIVFIGHSNNQVIGQRFATATGGVFLTYTTLDDAFTKLNTYIQNDIGPRDKNKTMYVEKGKQIHYAKYYADPEGDPEYTLSGEKWKYVQDTTYPSPDGIISFNNQWLDQVKTFLDKVGRFFVSFIKRDNPSPGNNFYDSYRKWSSENPIEIIVYEGTKPPEVKVLPKLAVDVQGDLRENHRVDFQIQSIKGTNDINAVSLNIKLQKKSILGVWTNTTEYQPKDKIPTKLVSDKAQFSRVFTEIGTYRIVTEIADIEGNKAQAIKEFNITIDNKPVAGFNVTGDSLRNDEGYALFKLTNQAIKTDDELGKIEYFREETRFILDTNENLIPDGKQYMPIINIDEIQIYEEGNFKVKQIVEDYYTNGIGLNGEELDQYRVFKAAETIEDVEVINEAPTVEYMVLPKIIKVGDKVKHIVDLKDDTPFGDYTEYYFLHDQYYYQNNNGKHELHNIITDEPLEILNKKGKYDFYVKGYDEEDKTTDWVHGGTVLVCTEPVSEFELLSSTKLQDDVFQKGSTITVKNNSYNPDYPIREGISYYKLEFKKSNEEEYITLFEYDNLTSYIYERELPVLNNIGIYEVKQTVGSPEGFFSSKISDFTIIDLRMEAELIPNEIYSSQEYKITAKLSDDGLGVTAYIPYLGDKTDPAAWVQLDKVNQDASNRYYEKTITTLGTLKDAIYDIEIYGMYPFNQEVSVTLPLTVNTPVELKSDIKPIGPIEYIKIITDNADNNDYIQVPASEKIKIEAEVISPLIPKYVKAKFNGDSEVSLIYNPVTNKYELTLTVPSTKADKDYYDLIINTELPNGNKATNNHRIRIKTPVELETLEFPNTMSIESTVTMKFKTSKYVNKLEVELFANDGRYRVIKISPTDISQTVDLSNSNKKIWTLNYLVPVDIEEGQYNANITAYAINHSSTDPNKETLTEYYDFVNIVVTGNVYHTEQWEENRKKYNISKTGDPNSPRSYDMFFPGEKFMLRAETNVVADGVNVQLLGTSYSTSLVHIGSNIWEGSLWDKEMLNWKDRILIFRFTAYKNVSESEPYYVEVQIVDDEYWRLHRKH